MKKTAAYFAAAFIAPHLAQAQTDTPTASAAPEVSNLVPIRLHSGVNVLPNFMPNGGSAMIVLGWRDNGNAHGSDLVVIMDQERTGGSWEVVAIDPLGNDAGEPNVLYDDPHTGDDVVSTFRFARGDVDGQAATLLLTATRGLGASIPAPSAVTFKTYELVHEGAITVGVTHDYFTPIATSTSSTLYCNADKALSDQFGLPLRSSYAGPDTPDGCPQTTAETMQSTPTISTRSPPPPTQTPKQANTDDSGLTALALPAHVSTWYAIDQNTFTCGVAPFNLSPEGMLRVLHNGGDLTEVSTLTGRSGANIVIIIDTPPNGPRGTFTLYANINDCEVSRAAEQKDGTIPNPAALQ